MGSTCALQTDFEISTESVQPLERSKKPVENTEHVYMPPLPYLRRFKPKEKD